MPVSPEDKKKTVYIRTAYRNEPNFITQRINRMGSILDGRKISMLIENDNLNKEKQIWAMVEKRIKAKESNRKRPSLIQRKNED